ncbi:ribonuclease yfkH [Pontibacillus halophilus JSM 076056 = DSM 19796]|uniref:Ribonuclease yfkH n=1 Tax=Pontibacillus halophilus JSM 076056 = DSM 19796 TaxID=1385510 RepID=A0A0A5IAZ9_9BACI|nr:YihY/virulence factor BrkB family protein [Pontibacillus halophilus]KGX92987.1 ribonuclease yfkH [Pontibacillus halophilus JSM 076056 = DSM 19796]
MSEAVRFVKELIKRFSDHEVAGLSAQLAYFFLLSLFPFMIFLFALVGYLPITQEEVLAYVRAYTPSDTLELVTSNLPEAGGGLLSVGIIGTLWSASNGINAVMRAFNHAYEVDENRPFLLSRFIAIFLTIAMFIVMIVALLLPVFGKVIGSTLSSYFGVSDEFIAVWEALRWLTSFLLIFFVLSSLYILAPNHRVHLRQALVGAVFATVAWQVVSLLFSFYVANFANYSSTYGSLGGIIILMIWFYLTGMIVLIGGEINAMLRKRKAFRN